MDLLNWVHSINSSINHVKLDYAGEYGIVAKEFQPDVWLDGSVLWHCIYHNIQKSQKQCLTLLLYDGPVAARVNKCTFQARFDHQERQQQQQSSNESEDENGSVSGNESDSGSGDDNTFLPPQLLDADIEINANDSNDSSS